MVEPRALGVANFTNGHLAGNAAVKLDEHGHFLELGPVRGWRLAGVFGAL